MKKSDAIENGLKIAAMEVEVKNLVEKTNNIENSMQSLHGKFDIFTTTITTNYVPNSTFEEYKKGRTMEKVTTVLITAIITGLAAYFLRGF